MSREIDALVAEHVMDGDIRPYSTVIQAAWAVVEKMKVHGYERFVLSINNEYPDGVWDAEFGKASGFHVAECGESDTAQMAIALAALKAKGIKPADKGE